MADESVPTTGEVRAEFVVNKALRMPTTWRGAEEFDRYLATHDAEIRAEALAPIRAALDGHPVCDVHPDDDPVSCGWKRAVADVRQALDA